MKGILGKKVGMTQVFTEDGKAFPVTAIEVQPNVVTSVFIKDKDGYNGIQLSVFDKKKSIQKKPEIGHFKKANTVPKKFVKEIREMTGYNLGDKVDGSIFSLGELVDVTGKSKGKGFAGAIKRHNQSILPKSHGGGGGSKPVRVTGGIGMIGENKVPKGMTMPGHMGAVKRTVQNLEVFSIDVENNFILVKGSVPGPKKGFVIIKEAVKGLPSKDGVKLVNNIASEAKSENKENSQEQNIEVQEKGANNG